MTYTTLKQDVLAFLKDVESEQSVPTFIRMAEAVMQRRLKVRQMIGTDTLTVATEDVAVPTDYAGPRTFALDATPSYPLEYLTPDALANLKASHATSGRPLYYTIIGANFRFLPAPGQSYDAELTYWQTIPALGDSNPTNWLLDAYPDAYIYGALTQAASFMGDERLAAWSTQFNAVLEEIRTADLTASYGQGLQVRPSAVA